MRTSRINLRKQEIDPSWCDPTTINKLFGSFLSQAAGLDPGHGKKYIQPVGSLNARIGFVLDMTGSRRDRPEPHSSENAELILPWGMAEMGLQPANSLVWTYNIQQYTGLAASDFTGASKSDVLRLIQNFHNNLINSSRLNVIFLCGPRAEGAITKAINSVSRVTLRIGHRRYTAYVHENKKRLFVRCPGFPKTIRAFDSLESGSITSLCDILKFGVALTETDEISPYRIEGSTTMRAILSQYALEETDNSIEQMTIETLGIGMRCWLSRRGFKTSDEIQELTQLAG